MLALVNVARQSSASTTIALETCRAAAAISVALPDAGSTQLHLAVKLLLALVSLAYTHRANQQSDDAFVPIDM